MASKVGRRDAYVGETSNQIREGFGVYNYENKFFRYEGEWKGGKKHGHGKLVMTDGSYYEGMFNNGEIEGHGYRYYSATGNTYSGEFQMGELTGQGIMKYQNGDVYEGMWHRNRRSGFGVFKHGDNSIYQGYSHNNMRHGEGTFIYSNGDRYDGDWVNDKRQGHGELRCEDGTLFDGQWLNDLFNGQGTMKHSSGMIYEGMWVNGHPANMAHKLVITVTPQDVLQGVYFSLEVQCQTEEGTPVHTDNGRELQVTAGFKNLMLTPVEEKTKTSMTGASSLFDVIEDVEEKPVSTPFDYDIVSFPLTDQMPDRETLGEPPEPSFLSSHQATSLTDAGGDAPADGENKEPVEGAGGEEEKKEEVVSEEATTKPGEEQEGAEPKAEREETSVEQQTETQEPEKVEEPARPEESLPPPVESKRTENGMVSYENLILPGAPPMYRPYMVMDEEARMEKAKQMAKTGKKVPKDKLAQEEQKSKAKKFGDERYARPGTYVIMVQDVTDPPFLGQRLEPGFLEVKVALPKKAKKVVKKERGPNWNTETFLTSSMAQQFSNVAKQDAEKVVQYRTSSESLTQYQASPDSLTPSDVVIDS